MKNQYVGDINDYQKYDLLQMLSEGFSQKTLIAWMLTDDDGRSDGRRISYLNNPSKYNKFNTSLFDDLKQIVDSKQRNINEIQNISCLKNKQKFDFVPEKLDSIEREGYFKSVYKKAENTGLVFFDPDNGLDFTTRPKIKSSKHLYLNEIETVWNKNVSVLFIQFYRLYSSWKERFDLVQKIIKIASELLHIQHDCVVPFYGKNAVFILILKNDLYQEDSVEKIRREWDKWEKRKQKIIAEDGKIFSYSICRDSNWSIGWGLGTVPIFRRIYSRLFYDTSEKCYYDNDGYTYCISGSGQGNELMRLSLMGSHEKHFKELYESKINAT